MEQHSPESEPTSALNPTTDPMASSVVRPMAETKLYSIIGSDGSRFFIDLPQTIGWADLRDHIDLLPGAKVTGFRTERDTETWMGFNYKEHTFSITNFPGDYWCFVKDCQCPEETLAEVVDHCERATGPWPGQFPRPQINFQP